LQPQQQKDCCQELHAIPTKHKPKSLSYKTLKNSSSSSSSLSLSLSLSHTHTHTHTHKVPKEGG
jgi:hypothetical protein